MSEGRVRRSYHRIIIAALVGLNCAAIAWAIADSEPGQLAYHFRDGSFISWFGSAQMFGAALLFVACYFAGNIIPLDKTTKRESAGWLVFAAGFFILAFDQQFRLREQLTSFIDGVPLGAPVETATHSMLKIIVALLAIGLVIYFRETVLANFRMVLAFIAGFWFLVLMLVVDMLFESVGVPASVAETMEGSAKLMAMAMFVSAPYVALLDRLREARLLARAGVPVAERSALGVATQRSSSPTLLERELATTMADTPGAKVAAGGRAEEREDLKDRKERGERVTKVERAQRQAALEQSAAASSEGADRATAAGEISAVEAQRTPASGASEDRRTVPERPNAKEPQRADLVEDDAAATAGATESAQGREPVAGAVEVTQGSEPAAGADEAPLGAAPAAGAEPTAAQPTGKGAPGEGGAEPPSSAESAALEQDDRDRS